MSVKVLWAPWRMEFLKSEASKSKECVFCEAHASQEDKKNLIVLRGSLSFLILNKYPYNNGHVMVVPNRHVPDFTQLSTEELMEMNLLVQKTIKTLTKCYAPQGFNVGMNLGEAAGAGIRGHIHLHVVPRWLGDTNFMPVLADTKSMPQHLTQSYELIQHHLTRTESP